MKKILLFLFFVVISTLSTFAQTPQTIPYQAVARNASGNLLVNQSICVQFRIYNQLTGGTLLYEEHQTATTNNLGLFTLNIGSGSYDGGTASNLSGIAWGSTSVYTEIGIDLTGACTGYTTLARSQMLSVPYALYAGSAGSAGGSAGGDLTGTYPNPTIATNKVTYADIQKENTATILGNNSGGLASPSEITLGTGLGFNGTNQIINTSPDQTVSFTNGNGIAVTGSYPNFTVTNTKPDQTVSISGTGITVGGAYPSFSLTTNNNGTVTSVGTSSPITGGTISGSGTIACPTCVTSTSGGAITGTAPVAVSAAGVVSCATCVTTSTLTGFAVPANKVGISATAAGSASTAIRSDATLTIDQTIAPTWTGTHTFSNGTYSALFTGGNVGIGTASPVNKLQVEGNLHMDGHPIYFRSGPSDNYDFVEWGGITGGSGNDRIDIAGYNGVDLGYSSPGTGITTVLSIASSLVNIPGLAASSAVYTDGSSNLTTTVPNNSTLGYWTRNNANGYLYNTTQSDKVGIGTTTPVSALQVYNSTSAATQLTIGGNPGTGGYTSLTLGTSANTGGYSTIQSIGTSGSSYGNLSLNASGGNVGIGTNTPNDKLEVNGNIRLTSGGSIYSPNQTSGGASASNLTVEAGNSIYSGACSYGGVLNLIGGNMNSDGVNCAGSSNAPASGNIYLRAGVNQFSNIVNGNIFFYAGESTTAQSQSNMLRMMIVGDNGYVGIGTSTPGYLLDVANNARFTNGGGTYVYVGSGGGAYYGDGSNLVTQIPTNGSFYMANVGTDGTRVSQADGTLRVGGPSQTASNLYVYGKAGMGTTSPAYTLDIAGKTGIDGANDGAIYMSGTKNTNHGIEWIYGSNDRYGMAQANGGNTAIYTSANYGPSFISFDLANAYTSNFTELMRITHAGWVGIGTTNPACALDVETVNGSFNQGSYRWFANSGSGTNTASCSSCNVSIYTPNRIEAAEFDATSDRRIKKNILSQASAGALDEARRLNVVTFNYIDQIQKGNKTKTGFIAQEVESVLPNAVNKDIGFIPNVFEAPVKTELVGNTLTVSTAKLHGFAPGDEIRIYDVNNKSHDVKVSGVNSPYEFVIKDWSDNADSLFVYGKKVEDYRNVDFDQVTAVAIGAVQELDKKVAALVQENERLDCENETLKNAKADASDVNELKQQNILLQNQMNALKELMEKNGIRSEK